MSEGVKGKGFGLFTLHSFTLHAFTRLSTMRGVELIQSGTAGAELAFAKAVEWRLHRAKMGMQVFRIGIDVQHTRNDLAGGLAFLQEIHCGDPVVDVV